MNAKWTRLWLSIRLVDLPLTALSGQFKTEDNQQPTVVIEKKRVIFANTQAIEAGVRLGMDITTTQLLIPCHLVERDNEQEEKALHLLSEELYQFSPYISVYRSSKTPESGLQLEISSCLTLFGGLKSLCNRVEQFLGKSGFAYALGLAHSEKAAWYLSFAPWQISGDETKEFFIQRLNQLPIQLLADYPKAVDALSKSGFTTFGDLSTQIQGKSISSFKKRFDAAFVELLCDLYDIDNHFSQQSLFAKPRELYKPDEWFEEEIQFEYPIALVDQLAQPIEHLLIKLSDYLRKRQQETQRIEWQLSDIYRRKEIIQVNSDKPQSQWQLLYDLTLIQLEVKSLPFEVDTLQLKCEHTLQAQLHTGVFNFEQSTTHKAAQDHSRVMAKLKALMGNSAVYKISYQDSRVPELTNAVVALAEKCHQQLPDIHAKALRPAWLLSSPQLIEQRKDRLFWQGYISPIAGPERVIGNWWEQPVARDYYLATRNDNLPLWIYFDLYEKKWFVHGVFA
ncbi:MAG: DNA polymerase Y family protein [Shewanella xiamenensis]|nr:DNA polymerase Y family protein [Shewanella xiamenensis]